MDSPDKISEMEAAARKLARKDAAVATVDLIEKTVSRSGSSKQTGK